MGVWLNAFSSVRAPRTEYCMGCRRRQPCSFTNQGRNQLVFGPISSDTRRTPGDGWQPQSHGRDGCKHARWLGDGSRCSPSWHLRHHAIRRIYVGTHQSRGWFRARLERWNRRRSPSALRWVQVVIRDDNRSLLAKPYLDPNPRETDGNPQYPFYYDELPAGDAGGFSNVDRRNLTAGVAGVDYRFVDFPDTSSCRFTDDDHKLLKAGGTITFELWAVTRDGVRAGPAAVGAAEAGAACQDNVDNDGDTVANDGCTSIITVHDGVSPYFPVRITV